MRAATWTPLYAAGRRDIAAASRAYAGTGYAR
jgi:hypothetical protein